MKITVCIGSSCHLKGSRIVVEQLRQLVAENGLEDHIELSGTFCMENCTNGVSVTLDGQLFSVSPQTIRVFYEKEVLPRITPIKE